MGKIIIKINTSNAAFDGSTEYETARILRELAGRIEDGGEPEKLKDINGNTVGTVSYK